MPNLKTLTTNVKMPPPARLLQYAGQAILAYLKTSGKTENTFFTAQEAIANGVSRDEGAVAFENPCFYTYPGPLTIRTKFTSH